MIQALEVKPREGLRIWLRFSDGSAGEVDLSDLAGRGVFRAWDRGGVFETAHVAPHGAVVWNGGIELCADSLYLELTGKSIEEVFPGLPTGADVPATSRFWGIMIQMLVRRFVKSLDFQPPSAGVYVAGLPNFPDDPLPARQCPITTTLYRRQDAAVTEPEPVLR